MTEITLKKSHKISVTISGHCNAERQNGHDLCCAAVSMLACTIMKRIEALSLCDKIIRCADGYAHIEFNSSGKDAKKGIECVSTIITGFHLLKDKYPQNIKIIRYNGGKVR